MCIYLEWLYTRLRPKLAVCIASAYKHNDRRLLSPRSRSFLYITLRLFEFAGQDVIPTMRRVSKSTARRLCVRIAAVLLIYVALKWTVLKDNKNSRLEFPLVCMFTTFKPNAQKMPVNMYFITYSKSLSLHLFCLSVHFLSVCLVLVVYGPCV